MHPELLQQLAAACIRDLITEAAGRTACDPLDLPTADPISHKSKQSRRVGNVQ
jgi:hypothetical protein